MEISNVNKVYYPVTLIIGDEEECQSVIVSIAAKIFFPGKKISFPDLATGKISKHKEEIKKYALENSLKILNDIYFFINEEEKWFVNQPGKPLRAQDYKIITRMGGKEYFLRKAKIAFCEEFNLPCLTHDSTKNTARYIFLKDLSLIEFSANNDEKNQLLHGRCIDFFQSVTKLVAAQQPFASDSILNVLISHSLNLASNETNTEVKQYLRWVAIYLGYLQIAFTATANSEKSSPENKEILNNLLQVFLATKRTYRDQKAKQFPISSSPVTMKEYFIHLEKFFNLFYVDIESLKIEGNESSETLSKPMTREESDLFFAAKEMLMPIHKRFHIIANPSHTKNIVDQFLIKITQTLFFVDSLGERSDRMATLEKNLMKVKKELEQGRWMQAAAIFFLSLSDDSLLISQNYSNLLEVETDVSDEKNQLVIYYQIEKTKELLNNFINTLFLLDCVNSFAKEKLSLSIKEIIENEKLTKNSTAKNKQEHLSIKKLKDWAYTIERDSNDPFKAIEKTTKKINTLLHEWGHQISRQHPFSPSTNFAFHISNSAHFFSVLKDTYTLLDGVENICHALQDQIHQIQQIFITVFTFRVENGSEEVEFIEGINVVNRRLVEKIQPCADIVSSFVHLFDFEQVIDTHSKDSISWDFGFKPATLTLFNTNMEDYRRLKGEIIKMEPSRSENKESPSLSNEVSRGLTVCELPPPVCGPEKSLVQEILEEKKMSRLKNKLLRYCHERGIPISMDSGKGSHINFHINGKLVTFPKGETLAIGTERKIKSDIQDIFEEFENKKPTRTETKHSRSKKKKK